LVVKIAHRYKRFGVPLDELIAEGNIGLLKAVRRYRAVGGARFCSYAVSWIKHAMLKAITDQGRIVRVPAQAEAKLRRIRKTKQSLTNRLARVPSEEEIATQLGITEASLRASLGQANTSSVSMDAQLPNSDSTTVGEQMADPQASSPEEVLGHTGVVSLLRSIVEQLDEREKTIIKMRYGFDGGMPKTLQQVGTIIGRTTERVRQIQHQALKKLKQRIPSGDAHAMMSFACAG
jgi:RNA polymerase primary sigma factor